MERVREEGARRLDPARLVALTESYDRLVVEGLQSSPPAGVPEGVCQQARSLLRRLESRKAEVPLFLTDFSLPFDNNQAERDLGMIKFQQKTSGCFSTEKGELRFCRIRSYLSTTRKQGRSVLPALEGACRGKPLSVGKHKE